MSNITLSDSLESSYGDKKARKKFSKNGYSFDKKLSNEDESVFYNKKENKLIVTVAGTHKVSDVGTDIYLAAGKLKSTKRYQSAKKTLEKARDKYKPAEVVVTGHSLGGAVARDIGKKNDKIITYNRGATIGEKKRKNETDYRTKGDIVSLFATKSKNLKSTHSQFDELGNHALKNIRKSNIKI